MNRWTVLVTALVLFAVVSLGCSNGADPILQTPEPPTVEASVQDSPQTYLWGYYDIYIDIATETATAVPDRTVMYASNIVQYLNNHPGNLQIVFNGCKVGVKNVDVDLNLTIKHPLPAAYDEYNIYDVRGIFIGNGSKTMGYNGDLKYAAYKANDQAMYDYDLIPKDPYDGLHGMPDGYTRWWNPKEFTKSGLFGYTPGQFATPFYKATATLNPYKYFATGLGVTDDCFTFLTETIGHGALRAGTSCTRNYYLRFPTPTPGTKSCYAIVANWKGIAPGDHPANAPEALALNCVITPNLYYIDESNNGGSIVLDLSIVDWDSKTSGTSGKMEDYRIYIESSVLSAVYTATASEMLPTGHGGNYYTYHLKVPADNVTSKTGQEVWVIVECKSQDYTYQWGSPNLADGDKLAACFRYNLPVLGQGPPYAPICDLEVLTPMPHVGRGHVDFDASGSTDYDIPDGDFLTFTWDFNGDGIFGDPYDSGADDKPMKDWNTDYNGQVSVKVTDSTSQYSECSVNVDITALREINVVGNPNIGVGLQHPRDIGCDPASDRVAINAVDSKSWRKFTNDYANVLTYSIGHNMGNLDAAEECILYGLDYYDDGNMAGWSTSDWNGTGYDEHFSGKSTHVGTRDVWNQQGSGTTNSWVLFDLTPEAGVGFLIPYYGIDEYGWNYCYLSPPWYGGTGSTGVVMPNLRAVDMAPGDSEPYTMYTLEAIPNNHTGVVEAWHIKGDWMYQAFGEGLLHDPLDLSVDSLGNIYVLESNSSNKAVIWAYDPSGTLIGSSDPLTETEMSGSPLRLDCFLFSNPDQVHVLHSLGVTKFRLEP